MQTIWKFTLEVTDHQAIELPEGAVPLDVQVQKGTPMLWALVRAFDRKLPCTIAMSGTGHKVPKDGLRYLATFQLMGGALVFRVFIDRPLDAEVRR